MSAIYTSRRHLLALTLLTLAGVLMHQPSKSSEPLINVVLGDIEGQRERLDSVITNSDAFDLDPEGHPSIKPGYRFIFMGDAVDKGPDAFYILETLNHFHQTQPDQVVSILGNRDINKLRLPHELSPEGLNQEPNEDAASQKFVDWLEDQSLPRSLFNDGVTRLKWILDKTMGAPQAFEFRRQALAKTNTTIDSDKVILDSFLRDLTPKSGIMSKFLQNAQLAFLDRNNRALFVHGGLTIESFGFIPNIKSKVPTIDQWVEELNRWAQNQISSGIANKDGAPELVKYQQPIPGTRANNASIVYGRNFDATANPELIPENLQNELLQQGVDTLVVAHTPVGEIPVIIANDKFRIIFVDNSTSSQKISSIVTMNKGVIEVRGPSPSKEFAQAISYRHKIGMETSVGQHRDNGWVIATTQEKELRFKIIMKEGFNIEYTIDTILPSSIKCRRTLKN